MPTDQGRTTKPGVSVTDALVTFTNSGAGHGARLKLLILDNRGDLDDGARRIRDVSRDQSTVESLEAVHKEVAYQSESAVCRWWWGIRVQVTFEGLPPVHEECHLDLALVGNHLLETFPAACVVDTPGSELLRTAVAGELDNEGLPCRIYTEYRSQAADINLVTCEGALQIAILNTGVVS